MPGGMGPHGPRGGAPTEKADDLGGVLKDLMRFSRRYIPAIIVALVLGVVGTVCQIIGPDYLGDMTDEITVLGTVKKVTKSGYVFEVDSITEIVD